MSTATLEIIVPDYFPDDWVDNQPGDDEHGELILVETRKRRIRANVQKELRIPFTMPGGFPKRPGDRRQTTITHTFTEDIHPTNYLVDGPAPWTMRALDNPPLHLGLFLKGDGLTFDITLAAV